MVAWQATETGASLKDSLLGALQSVAGYGADLAIKAQYQERNQAIENKLTNTAHQKQLVLGKLQALQKDQDLLQQVWEEKYFELADKVQLLNKPEPRKREPKPKPLLPVQAELSLTSSGTTAASAPLPGRYRSAKELMQQPGGEPVVLAEPFRTFLGKLERKNLSITLTGGAGSGKTHFSFQLAKAFCHTGLKVLFYSLEMGCESQLFKDLLLQYGLSDQESFCAEPTATLAEIKEAAWHFDVIFIDSWTKLKGVKGKEFGELSKQFPQLVLVAIFQQNSSGKIRGGTEPIYDSFINLEVKDGEARNEKTRFGGRGTFSMFSQLEQ